MALEGRYKAYYDGGGDKDEKEPVFKYIDMIFVVVLEMVRQLALKTKKLHRRLLTYSDGTLNVKTSDGREVPAIKYLEEQIQIESLKRDLDKAFIKLKMDVKNKLEEIDEDVGHFIEESVDEEENYSSDEDFKSSASNSKSDDDERLRTTEKSIESMRIAERLAKIRSQTKPKPILQRTVIASSAINRKKMQWDIERKNAMLARKIANAKSCLYKSKYP